MTEPLGFLVVELVILIILARMGCALQYTLILITAFLSILAYLVIGTGFIEPAQLGGSMLVVALVLFCAGRLLWQFVRNPAQTLNDVDTYLMEDSVAKQLAQGERGPGAPASYGNWRVAREVVRKLKERK